MKKLILTLAFLTSVITFATPAEDLKKADELLTNGDEKNAVVLINKVLKEAKPNSKEANIANLAMGQLNIRSNNLKEAKTYLLKLAGGKLDSNEKLEAVSNLASIASLEKNYKEEIKYLEMLKKYVKNNYELYANLIFAYTNTNNAKEVNNLWKEIAKLGVDATNSTKILLGDNYVKNDKFEQANKLYKEVSTSKNNDLKSIALLRLSNTTQDIKEVESYLLEVKKLNPKDPGIPVLLANLYINTGNLKKGFELYKESLALDSKNEETRLMLLLLAEALNDKTSANKYYKELKNNKKIQYLDSIIATTAMNLNSFETAEKYLLLADKSDKLKENNLKMAIVKANLKKKSEALRYVNLALKDNVQGAKELKAEIEKLK